MLKEIEEIQEKICNFETEKETSKEMVVIMQYFYSFTLILHTAKVYNTNI